MSFKLLRTNVLVLLIAFLLAAVMWYRVTIYMPMEVQREVFLDYHGLPEDLVVLNGLADKVTVRFRGPEVLIRSLAPNAMRYSIDLSTARKGTTPIPLVHKSTNPAFRAFEVIDMQPSRLILDVDQRVTRNVPVKAELKSSLQHAALTVTGVEITPPTVSIRGPERVLNKMNSVKVTIPLNPNALAGVQMMTLPLEVPNLVTPQPANVTVRYTVTSGRKVVLRQRLIAVAAQDRQRYTVTPSTLSFHVEVPENLANDETYMGQIRLWVVPPAQKPDSADISVPLNVSVPDGMTILDPLPKQVTLTQKTARK